jgi:dynamin GTPase
MFMMVNRMKDYIQTDLLPMIYASGNQDSLMEESTESARRRDETIKMYHTCKDALQLISEVSTKTSEFCVAVVCEGRRERGREEEREKN